MVKAKPNQKFHVDKLNTALSKLDQLESKPKEELTLRESIYFMRGKLNRALKKGYSYEDLSEILAEQDILVSTATLKLYLTEGSKSKKSSARKKKSKSSSGAVTSSQSSPILSTNITDSKEELGTSNSHAEINRIKEQKNSKTGTKSDSGASKKAKTTSQSIGRQSSSTKTNVLSGSDDDLSSEFNDF